LIDDVVFDCESDDVVNLCVVGVLALAGAVDGVCGGTLDVSVPATALRIAGDDVICDAVAAAADTN